MTTIQKFTEQKVRVNNIGIHVVDWGNGDLAAKMLWVHGMSGTAHYWDLVAPEFRDGYHLVCPTLRGRGDSECAADASYDTDDYVEDMHALVEQLGWQRFIFVGASLGGLTGIRYAMKYPDQVERLVMVDIGARVGTGEPSRPGEDRFADAPETFASPDEGWEFLRPFDLFTNLDAPARDLVVKEGFAKDDQGGWTWRYDPVIREQRRKANESGTLYFPDQWDDVRQIACPTLIMRGSRSDVLSPEVARQTLEAIRDSRMVEIHDSGHLPYLEQREQFVKALRDFLAEA